MSVKIFWLLAIGFGCTGCDIPKLFWEEEVRQVVDDVVDEKEKIHPTPKDDASIAATSQLLTHYETTT